MNSQVKTSQVTVDQQSVDKGFDAGVDFETIAKEIHSIDHEVLSYFEPGQISSDPTCERDHDVFQEIEPACRLANAIPMHDAVLPFWHGMKVASQRYKKLEVQGKPKPVKYFSPRRTS